MITLNIYEKKLKVPNILKEIPLYRIQELYSMLKDDGNYSYDEKLVLCATVFGLEPNIFYGIKPDSLDDIFSNILFLNDKPEELYYTRIFNLKGITYGIINYDELTVYEYMELEDILKNSDTPFENIDKVLAVLCRRVIAKKIKVKNILYNIIYKIKYRNIVPKVYEDYKIKQYEEKDLQNDEVFGLNMDAAFGIAILNSYIEFKKQLQKDYPTIYEQPIPIEDKDQYDEEPIIKQGKSFEEIWGLYNILDSISSNIFERDEWRKRNIKEFLTYVTFSYAKQQQLNKMNNNSYGG